MSAENIKKTMSDDKATLKPCPFCGGAPETGVSKWSGLHYVLCVDDCHTRPGEVAAASAADAVRMWNTRVGDDDLVSIHALVDRYREALDMIARIARTHPISVADEGIASIAIEALSQREETDDER